jgi:hypothetical protein
MEIKYCIHTRFYEKMNRVCDDEAKTDHGRVAFGWRTAALARLGTGRLCNYDAALL